MERGINVKFYHDTTGKYLDSQTFTYKEKFTSRSLADVRRNQLTLFRFMCQTIAFSDITQPRVGIVPTKSGFEKK